MQANSSSSTGLESESLGKGGDGRRSNIVFLVLGNKQIQAPVLRVGYVGSAAACGCFGRLIGVLATCLTIVARYFRPHSALVYKDEGFRNG